MRLWTLTYEGFDPGEEPLREALCVLGNGYFATRGAAPESTADDVHYPGTYLAGGYGRLETEIAGRVVENEDLVNMPNWLPLTFRIDGGDWFDLRAVKILHHVQDLDLRQGVLTRRVRFRDGQGRTTDLTQRRLVHMGDPHLAALQTTILPEDWSGRLEVRSALDGTVRNAGVARYRDLRGDHLVPLETGAFGDDGIWLAVETRTGKLRVAEAARTRVLRNGDVQEAERRLLEEEGFVAHDLTIQVERDEPVTIDKVVALATARDRPGYEPALDARGYAERAGTFEDLLPSHVLAWDQLWRRFDLTVDGRERAQLVLRVHIFHLLQVASEHTIDLDVGVPARGLHGEAYRGHIFWDELFIFPFLNYRLSALTRSFLEYRHRRLPEARWAAGAAGHHGAMYPWQSGSTGREESQTLHLNPKSGHWLPDHSHLQQHINVAVAYNVWQYYQVTGDVEFLRFHGAGMLIEIARFWSSLATYNRTLDRYEILGVMGPDEYHDAYPGRDEPGLDNNAYTNLMAVWVLHRALELFEIVPDYHRQELWEGLGLTQEELDRWEDITRKMRLVFHGDGILSQFEGYDELREFDWDAYRAKYGDIHRLDRILEAEGDSTNNYKVSKQADVLMLCYLLSHEELTDLMDGLGYECSDEMVERNVRYYLQRTSHGSTLSRLVHSWVIARIDREHSWRLFMEALESDVSDVQGGTTPEGIHLGAMAGTVDMVQRGYSGLEVREDVLRFDPALPEEASRLAFEVHYRRMRISVEITSDRLLLEARPGPAAPVRVAVRGEELRLAPGERIEWKL